MQKFSLSPIAERVVSRRRELRMRADIPVLVEPGQMGWLVDLSRSGCCLRLLAKAHSPPILELLVVPHFRLSGRRRIPVRCVWEQKIGPYKLLGCEFACEDHILVPLQKELTGELPTLERRRTLRVAGFALDAKLGDSAANRLEAAQCLDLSPGGCRLLCSQAPSNGTVILRIGAFQRWKNLTLGFEVVWQSSTKKQTGLRFLTEPGAPLLHCWKRLWELHGPLLESNSADWYHLTQLT